MFLCTLTLFSPTEESASVAAHRMLSSSTSPSNPNPSVSIFQHTMSKSTSEIPSKFPEMSKEAEAVLLDENLLYEVLRHVDDGRTLSKAACLAARWKRTAHDERLWEPICTKHYHRSPMRLCAIVLRSAAFAASIRATSRRLIFAPSSFSAAGRFSVALSSSSSGAAARFGEI
ncbi:hypothetical protein DH2020_006334 [Rehmannia glutinosa]|uniref:F-box protein n=1 Tax=Rehmannia glutinosa TaxID=99300 RepID=A0ABR0XIS7_REHGL